MFLTAGPLTNGSTPFCLRIVFRARYFREKEKHNDHLTSDIHEGREAFFVFGCWRIYRHLSVPAKAIQEAHLREYACYFFSHGFTRGNVQFSCFQICRIQNPDISRAGQSAAARGGAGSLFFRPQRSKIEVLRSSDAEDRRTPPIFEELPLSSKKSHPPASSFRSSTHSSGPKIEKHRKTPSHLRSSEPKIEEPPIFDLRPSTLKIEEPPL